MYEVTVLWDGLPRRIYAYMSDSAPLIGMRLLDGYDLNIPGHERRSSRHSADGVIPAIRSQAVERGKATTSVE